MNLGKMVNFDSVRLYRWLLSVAGPNPELYRFLRTNNVDLGHIFNLLHGAVGFCRCSVGGLWRPAEDSVVLPVFEADDETPVDVLAFSIAKPTCFATMLGLGAVLGANSIDNPSTYIGGQPCRLLRTPLAWLEAGMVGCAVVLDPKLARPALDAAPGDLASDDEGHARELVGSKAVDIDKLLIPVRTAAA
jgi:hypothetical protein